MGIAIYFLNIQSQLNLSQKKKNAESQLIPQTLKK